MGTINLEVGATGVLADGSEYRSHNQNLHCQWWLRATELVRFNFFVNMFDIEETPDCAADSLQFLEGDNLIGSYCGTLERGQLLMSVKASELYIDFVTDDAVERNGFNITYVVAEKLSLVPESYSAATT